MASRERASVVGRPASAEAAASSAGAAAAPPARSEDAERAAPAGVTIVREPFAGWTDTYRVANGRIEARVLADVGPRVLELRPRGGTNLLHLRERELGGRGEPTWRFRGGWRLWLAPERRATTYALDNAPCAVARLDDGALRVSGPPQPEAGVRKHVTLRIDASAPRLTVESRVENVGPAPVTHALWTLAALRPGGRAFLPMETGPLDALDAVRRLVVWSYARPDDPRYRFGDRLLEIDHRAVLRGPGPTWLTPARASDESKIGVDATAGWAAYLFDRTLFVSRAVVEDGPRVDGGCTLECYSSREFVELEHLGVLRTIAPGASLALDETWTIHENVVLPNAEDGMPALAAALAPYVAMPS